MHVPGSSNHAAIEQLRGNRVLCGHFLAFVNRAIDFSLDQNGKQAPAQDEGIVLTRHDVRRWTREVMDGPPDGAQEQPDGSWLVQTPGGLKERWTQRGDGTWRKPASRTECSNNTYKA